MSGATPMDSDYAVPQGVLGLKGPVERPAPGTLPLRGDLAHMALAGTHLSAHYVIPHIHTVGEAGAASAEAPTAGAGVAAGAPRSRSLRFRPLIQRPPRPS